MPHPALDAFRRYADLLSAALAAPVPFTPESEDAAALQVERGMVYPLAIAGKLADDSTRSVDRLIDLAAAPDWLASVVVVDSAGHRRPAYRGLLVYAWLQAFRLEYERLPRSEFGRWDEASRAWCDRLEAELTGIALPNAALPASLGSAAAQAAWTALALWAAGRVFVRDAWTDLAADAFGRLTRAQHVSGTFLTATASDNPETLWYHELVILHAAASYAVQAEDRTVAAAVKRNSAYHLRETQPDHATTQPWGLFAFVWNPPTRPLADQLLHAAKAQHAGGAVGGVSSLLLADALYCLRLFDDAPAAP